MLKGKSLPSLAACYEGCPGILMASLDENERALDRASVSSAVLPPWKLLSKTQEHVSEYRVLVMTLATVVVYVNWAIYSTDYIVHHLLNYSHSWILEVCGNGK